MGTTEDDMTVLAGNLKKERPTSAATYSSQFLKSTFSKQLKSQGRNNIMVQSLRHSQMQFLQKLPPGGLNVSSTLSNKDEYKFSTYTTKAKIMKEIENMQPRPTPKSRVKRSPYQSRHVKTQQSSSLKHTTESVKNNNRLLQAKKYWNMKGEGSGPVKVIDQSVEGRVQMKEMPADEGAGLVNISNVTHRAEGSSRPHLSSKNERSLSKSKPISEAANKTTASQRQTMNTMVLNFPGKSMQDRREESSSQAKKYRRQLKSNEKGESSKKKDSKKGKPSFSRSRTNNSSYQTNPMPRSSAPFVSRARKLQIYSSGASAGTSPLNMVEFSEAYIRQSGLQSATTTNAQALDFKIKEEENEHEEESMIITPADATESEIEKIRIRKS